MALDPAYSPVTPSTSEAKTSDITELLSQVQYLVKTVTELKTEQEKFKDLLSPLQRVVENSNSEQKGDQQLLTNIFKSVKELDDKIYYQFGQLYATLKSDLNVHYNQYQYHQNTQRFSVPGADQNSYIQHQFTTLHNLVRHETAVLRNFIFQELREIKDAMGIASRSYNGVPQYGQNNFPYINPTPNTAFTGQNSKAPYYGNQYFSRSPEEKNVDFGMGMWGGFDYNGHNR